jgi:hypothetical protein
MLMRSDPFRGLDALLAEQLTGSVAWPTQMPIDAYRSGEASWCCLTCPVFPPPRSS